jgi:acetyl-CoA carboxylase carboxyltransferase component
LVDKYNAEASPYFTAARLMIDGILDPRDTRKSLIAGLEMAANNPELAEFKTGVMRM